MTELVVTRVRVVVNGPSAFARTTTRPFFGTTTVNIFEFELEYIFYYIFIYDISLIIII